MKLLLFPGRHTNCPYAVTWSGKRIHRRSGEHLWCVPTRRHAGPPSPQWLAEWRRCRRCFR